MANVFKPKRSSTALSVPTTSDLTDGELAVNSSDKKIYLRAGSSIVKVGSGQDSHITAPHGSTVTIEVKVITKTAAHRYNGTGSGSGYTLDGVESPFLILTPGRTYKFDQADSSNSSHPLRFYLEADKTTQYSTNVTTNGTAGSAGAYTQILVTDETPIVLHYQCSAHGYMGNAIQSNSNKINTPYLIEGLNGANITGVVTATSFSGTATNASNVTLADESSDTICYPTFSTDPTGNQALKTDQSNLLYNANTGSLSAASFSGDGSTLNNVLSNLSEDETPQLGGGLDLNGSDITGSGHIDITGNLDVSGISSVGTAITMYGSTGIVSATEFHGDGSNLTSIVTQLTAGTGISLNQTTGNVTITATSNGGDADPTTRTTSRFVATASQSSFTVSYNVGYVDVFLNGIKLDSTEYTATNGSSVSLTSAAAADDIVEIVAYESVGITSISSATQGLDVTGHLETDTLNVSGIATITGGIDAIGIQSGGVNIATGPITALNFIGAGNTFSVNGGTVDISISGGGGSTTRTVNRYVATANQTLFPASGTVDYTVGYVDVFINGTKLDSTEFTASNGTTVTLTTGATVDDIVELIAFSDVSISGDVTAAFKTISVSGQSDIVADSAADTLTLVAGSNMTITTNASGDSVTFSSSGGANFNELDAALFS